MSSLRNKLELPQLLSKPRDKARQTMAPKTDASLTNEMKLLKSRQLRI